MNRSLEFDLPLALMREQLASSALLPKPYARYQTLVADALHFFLQHLPSARLRPIFAEQMRFAPSVRAAERIVAVLRHSPALHKLGQIVARDRRLTKSFRNWLMTLESLAPKTPIAWVTKRIDSECRNWRKAGIELEPHPLAEGSVAVIIPFTWGSRPLRQGVFKLLRPGVEKRLEEDLEILSLLGVFLDERCEYYGVPALDYQDIFETIRQLLRQEIRFEQEQQNLAEAARVYSQASSVVIPSLLPFCSPKLTAMERVQGHRLPIGGDFPHEISRNVSASVLVEALFAQPIFSPDEEALFHADPHAGNLLFMPGGRVAILDWSLTGRLNRAQRSAMVQLMLAAISLDFDRMDCAVQQLAQRRPNQSEVSSVLRSGLRELRWGVFPGINWFARLLDQLTLRAGVQFTPNLLLLRKALFTLEWILADLMWEKQDLAQAVINAALITTFLGNLVREWPDRFFAPMNEKSSGTQLSTTDLLGLIWSGAGTFARRWSQDVDDFLNCPEHHL